MQSNQTQRKRRKTNKKPKRSSILRDLSDERHKKLRLFTLLLQL